MTPELKNVFIDLLDAWYEAERAANPPAPGTDLGPLLVRREHYWRRFQMALTHPTTQGGPNHRHQQHTDP